MSNGTKMTHTYNVSGMTCSGCQAKVQSVLSNVKGIKNVRIDLSKGEATLDMDKHVPTNELQFALKNYPKYQLTENGNHHQNNTATLPAGDTKSWVETYKPILLVFGYILGVTILIEAAIGSFIWPRWMEHFVLASVRSLIYR